MKNGKRTKNKGLATLSGKSDDIAEYYDNWSDEYDTTLAGWRYDAPRQVASMLGAELSSQSKILDAGCGAGLSGKALSAAGFENLEGIDVSKQSLKIAETSGAYSTLLAMDMQRLPLPIPDDQYDGLACVGVLTYLPDTIEILQEFCRIVRKGGLVAVTQRSDLFAERRFGRMLQKLADEQVIEHVQISEPRPYLPDNEEFGDEILVHYVAFRVT